MSGAEYLLLKERIDTSLNSMLGYMCSRPCCFKHPHKLSENPQGYHTYIGLSKRIWGGKNFTEEEIKKYEQNIKHGVVHGVLTFVISCAIKESLSKNLTERIDNNNICTLKNSEKISNSELEIATINYKEFAPKEKKLALNCFLNPSEEENLLVSCLAHDFIKCSHGHEDHDKNLIEYFPKIDPITLNHSSPLKNQENHSLIRADRIELQRFSDHNDWIDKEKVFRGYNDLQVRLINLFYKKIRPVLEKSYEFRNERWVRHGLERHISTYPFKESYPSETIQLGSEGNNEIFFEEEGLKYWSVELSKGSLGDCIVGQKEPRKNFEAGWQEINAFFPWELIQGKIPLKEYKNKTSQKLIPCLIRDHFLASGTVPTKDWVFTHKNINSKMLEILLEQDVKICHEDTVALFLKTCEKVVDIFYGAKLK